MKPKRRNGPQPIPRIATGVEQLDVILRGGFLKGGSYIVSGHPGTGKTVFGNQVGFRHVASGGSTLYVSLLAESHGRMLSHISSMSFYDQEAIGTSIQYVSGYEVLRTGGLKGLLSVVRTNVKRFGSTLLVVDGIVTAERAAPSSEDFKVFIHEMNVALSLLGCTAVLLTNVLDDDRSYAARTMVDGLIQLEDVMDGVRAVRQLVISKFRGSDYLRGAHFFEIGSDGIRVYARVEAMLALPTRTPEATSDRSAFGVPDLDAMMEGGPADGTSTLVLGSSGTGKTILGMHFLSEGARQKEPGLYFGFFESPSRFLKKGDLLGLQLSKYVRNGLLETIWQPTGGAIMDALAERLFEAVRRRKVKRLVIDGIAAFEESVVRPERLGIFFTSVANELRGLGVTTLFTEEMRELFGSEVIIPLSGVAGFAENIIVVRQLEIASELKRAIAVMKTRETGHDERLREMKITAEGIVIGEPFESDGGVLTGGDSRGRLAPAAPSKMSKRGGRGSA